MLHGARSDGAGDEEFRELAGPGVVVEIGGVYECSCLVLTVSKQVGMKEEVCSLAVRLILTSQDRSDLMH